MNLAKVDWYLILLGLVILALISANEFGFGVIAFIPLMPLAYWLMEKAFGSQNPPE